MPFTIRKYLLYCTIVHNHEYLLEENFKKIAIKGNYFKLLAFKRRENMAPPIFFAKNNIPLFLLLNDKYQELPSACDALGMPLDHINHIHQSM